MKFMALLFATLALASGALSVHLYGQAESAREQARTEASRAAALAEETELLRKSSRLAMSFPIDSYRAPALPAATLSAAATGSAAAVSPNRCIQSPEELEAEMRRQRIESMQDPKNRARMRAELLGQIREGYQDFIKELKLSPDEATRFVETIVDHHMQSADAYNAIDPKDQIAMQALAQTEQRKLETALVAVLGNRFQQYDAYEKSSGERSMVKLISQELSGNGGAALKEDQQKRLLAAMLEEKQRIPQPVVSSGAMTKYDSQARIDWYLDYQKRILDRAEQLLTPEQFKRYEAIMAPQLQNLQQQRAGT